MFPILNLVPCLWYRRSSLTTVPTTERVWRDVCDNMATTAALGVVAVATEYVTCPCFLLRQIVSSNKIQVSLVRGPQGRRHTIPKRKTYIPWIVPEKKNRGMLKDVICALSEPGRILAATLVAHVSWSWSVWTMVVKSIPSRKGERVSCDFKCRGQTVNAVPFWSMTWNY